MSYLKLFYLLITIFVFKLTVSYSSTDVSDDYYWRYINGSIPRDAYAAGLTTEDRTTYIGQGGYYDSLWFGDVRENGVMFYYSHGQLIIENELIKVFCTNRPQRFQWRHFDCRRVFALPNEERLVSGEYYLGKCFVGRKQFGGRRTVGTVCFNYTTGNFELFAGHESGGTNSCDFELLEYQPVSK